MSKILRPLCAVKVLFLFALIVQAQTHPPLLGPSDLEARATRSPAGFLIHGRGLIGRYNPKRVRKSAGWLKNHGAGHLAGTDDNPGPFVLEAGFISDHWYLISETDAAWAATKERWTACGERYEQVARSTSPRSITIYIEDRPFTHPAHPGVWLNGMTDGQVIRAVVVSANGVRSDPGAAWLVTYRQVLEWEMGNLLGVRMGVPFTGVAGEIGNRSPCESRD